MELKSWIVYDPSSSKCSITGTKPFELNLSDVCRNDFDKYLVGKHSLDKGLYKLVDVVSDVTEFCEKTNYKVNIKSITEEHKYGFSDYEKIIIDEIVPRPIRNIWDIENVINPFS